jgi:hypothetical protein
MRYIAGFAQACWVSATDFLALGSQLTVTEEALLQQINTEGEATMAGMDCDGCDLRLKDQLQRIQFAGFAADVQAVRDELAALAQRVQGE